MVTMKHYLICSCDGGEALSLVEADDPEEALDVALFEARARFAEAGLSPVASSRLLLQWRRAYAAEVA